MDGQRFDAITKALARSSRRRALQVLAGGALGVAPARFRVDTTAA